MGQPAISEEVIPQLPTTSEVQNPPLIVESTDENGVVTQRATYINGVLDGEFLAFNAKGVVVKRFFYQQGNLHSEALIYNDDGALIQRLNYEDGMLNGPLQSFKNNVMVMEIPYVKGIREGIGRLFADNGRLQQETTFKADKENGIRTIYNTELGVVVRTETVVDGVVEGQSLTFYPNGSVMMQQGFEKGLLQGKTIQLYESGIVQQVSIYDKGVLTMPPQKFDLTGKEI